MIAWLRAALCSRVLWANLAAGAAPAAAADYPNRPVRWLIGFSAGGPVDIVARIMSQWLSASSSWENRSGSGGNLAAAAVINAPPDGYTLLFVGPNNTISTSLYKKLPFDFMRDTVPVASIMQLTNMLVVSNAMPVKTGVDRLLPGQSGQGFLCLVGLRYLGPHVGGIVQGADQDRDGACAYRGSAVAYPDIMSNKVQLIFDNLPSALEQARAGNVRALGVTSPQRWPGVPDIPAIAETVPGFEAVGFYGIAAPKGTPPEIVYGGPGRTRTCNQTVMSGRL